MANAVSAAPADPPPLLEVSGLEKSFGGVRALRDVRLDVRAGEVHGLVGANGAGKSTLIRTLAGLEKPDRGRIRIDGEAVEIPTPQRAAELGFGFIHQELNLVASMTGLQNVMLGLPKPLRLGTVDWRAVRATVAPVARRVGIVFPLDARVAVLSTAQRWLLSICRALMQRVRLIVMDEPTASLSAHEAENLFRIVRQLRDDGVAVLYVSHRLGEILDLCDRVTALRDGANVLRAGRSALTRQVLVDAIVGGSGATGLPARLAPRDGTAGSILAVDRLVRWPAVRGVTFSLRRGEVLGLTGLVGAGRSELVRLIYGADRPHAGAMTLDGDRFSPRTPRDAVRSGIGLVPEERRSEGLVLGRGIAFNMALPANGRFARTTLPTLSFRRRTRWAEGLAERLGIRAATVEAPVRGLSGGNQQKVVIGRWIDRDLRILILDEPSRGVDIGARGEIHRLIRELASGGLSVIVVSSEAEELPGLCDRVLVMAEGVIAGEFEGDAIARDALVAASYRHHPAPEVVG